MVDHLARNIKGKYTEEALVNVCRSFDRDGNGLISAAGLRQVVNSLSENLTDKEVDEIVREADVDGDGIINYEEFVRITMFR